MTMWVVVKIIVPFWLLNLMRHLVLLGVLKGDHSVDKLPCGSASKPSGHLISAPGSRLLERCAAYFGALLRNADLSSLSAVVAISAMGSTDEPAHPPNKKTSSRTIKERLLCQEATGNRAPICYRPELGSGLWALCTAHACPGRSLQGSQGGPSEVAVKELK